MTKICIFCSSTSGLNQDYIDIARKMGQLMGEKGHHLVYGGSHRGLMGELASKFTEYSEEITEIIPKMWTNLVIGKGKTIITEGFGERLKNMQELSDAFIVLPGGFGSIHEMMDVLVAKQLKLHNKPLILINTHGIYNSIIEQIKRLVDEGLAPEDNDKLIHVVNTPEEALDYIENYIPTEVKDKN